MVIKNKVKIPIYNLYDDECNWCSIPPKRSEDFAICTNPIMIKEYSKTGSFILGCKKDCPGKLLAPIVMSIKVTTREELIPQLREVLDDDIWIDNAIQFCFLDTMEELGFGNQLVRKV